MIHTELLPTFELGMQSGSCLEPQLPWRQKQEDHNLRPVWATGKTLTQINFKGTLVRCLMLNIPVLRRLELDGYDEFKCSLVTE